MDGAAEDGEAPNFSEAFRSLREQLMGCGAMTELHDVAGTVREAKEAKTLTENEVAALRQLYSQCSLKFKEMLSSTELQEPEIKDESHRSGSASLNESYVVVEDVISEQPHDVLVPAVQETEEDRVAKQQEAMLESQEKEAAEEEPEEEMENLPRQRQWEKLFDRPDFFETLKFEATAGMLQRTSLRSVCWKLFFGLLGSDLSKWETETETSRKEFTEALKELITDPHNAKADIDLTVNNPLSQEDTSPWQQYFKDTELKAFIKQDVTRTFPDLEFFQEEETQTDLLNILFCYARRNPTVSYRQGMHELLALIYYLLARESLAAEELEEDGWSETMKTVLHRDFVSHDAYMLFNKVMAVAHNWYEQGERTVRRPSKQTVMTDDAVVFRKDEDNMVDDQPTSAILLKLSQLNNRLLKQYDPELYQRLEILGIPPQIYGLRWVRLLCGREFPIEDVYLIWDAIFADNTDLQLIDYICIAMLSYLREYLLAKEYTDCLRILMKFPPVQEPHAFVRRALHVRDPEHFPKNPFHDSPLPNEDDSSRLVKGDDSTTNLVWGMAATIMGTPKRTSRSSRTSFLRRKSKSKQEIAEGAETETQQQSRPEPSGKTSSFSPKETASFLQSQIKCLKAEKEELQRLTKLCGQKLNSHIEQLQRELLNPNRLPNEDITYLAVAGVKEVKDVLLGHLRAEDIGFFDSEKLMKQYQEKEINDAEVPLDSIVRVQSTTNAAPVNDSSSSNKKNKSKRSQEVIQAPAELLTLSETHGEATDFKSLFGEEHEDEIFGAPVVKQSRRKTPTKVAAPILEAIAGEQVNVILDCPQEEAEKDESVEGEASVAEGNAELVDVPISLDDDGETY